MRRTPTLVLSMLVVLAALVSGCGAGQEPSPGSAGSSAFSPVTIKHAQGELKLEREPRRVVVMDLGALDTLQALGLSDRVVALPKANIPAFLSAFGDKSYTDAGTLFEPNYEAINQARPDLVIIGNRSAKTYAEMSKLFPTLDVTATTKNDFLKQIAEPARLIGQAFGKQAQVEERMTALSARAEQIKGRGAQAGKGLIVMTSGGKVSAHGGESRFGAVHTLLGVQPAVADLQSVTHGQPISFEFIAQADPDVLFVVDRDAAIGEKGASAMTILDNAVVQQTKAWKNKRIVQLDGARWYVVVHGLDNAVAMLDEVAKGLGA